jgi:DNA-binding NarL/FixJ family response regulator
MEIKIYPGMSCHGLEFFLHGSDFKIIQHGQVKAFDEIPYQTSQIILEAINASPEITAALLEMHPDSQSKRIEQFAKCRFGGLDFQADIIEGELQDGEYWACPLHGSCKHEGVLCKLPKFNQERLTKEEIQLMQLSTSEKTNEAIADALQLPMGTFHQRKNTLHKKLGVQTKQGLTKISIFLNLIWQ